MRRMMDCLLDENNDLKAVNGDFSVVESTMQHQKMLVLCNKGDYAANPTICVGAETYIDEDDGNSALIREIVTQFTKDGMSVQSVKLNKQGQLISNAEY